MKSLETFGILTQAASQNERIYGAPIAKKLMTLEDNEEFIAMVIAFAERKSMTISNIKDAVREAIVYMEDNATLIEFSNDELMQGKRYCVEEATKLSESIAHAAELDDQIPAVQSQASKIFSGNVRKDEKLAREIYNMILGSYNQSGISIQEVRTLLKMTEKMFEYTLLLPNKNIQQD
ncbi:MAG: hypothetical protein OSJ73_08310 [Lachnospiraceae bacterium]|nr:hypothetical protein [Lachnospiraceae bacterium]HBV83902.1 hypothetical protein [Lachnospiraceae bacterium]